MSTLAEIEAAADALPLEQKKKLLEFLASRVNGEEVKKLPSICLDSLEHCNCRKIR